MKDLVITILQAIRMEFMQSLRPVNVMDENL